MKRKIAVVSGGFSGEYGVSVRSAKVVNALLNRDLYEVYDVLITKDKWALIDHTGKETEINRHNFTASSGNSTIGFDCAFIAIHGSPGEDGLLQGYLDMLNIPYTSCNAATSALTFNKYFCKLAVRSLGVQTAKEVFLRKGMTESISCQSLSLPLFVKPNNGGSSIGMSKVTDFSKLNKAIDMAFNEDCEVIIEEFISGREITCGVYELNGQQTVLPLGEIISKRAFFDYTAKYDPTLADEIIPAVIPEPVAHECRETSAGLYKALNCSGVVRFDYIFNDNGLFFLEVNTVPGLTAESIVPKMIKNCGLTLEHFFNLLTEDALQRAGNPSTKH